MSLFLKICYYNFLISVTGFGSGQVYLSYINDYYLLTGIITEAQYNTYVGITEILPGATSVKLLTQISFDQLGFLETVITILVFSIPTIIIIYLAARLMELQTFKKFFTLLGFFFTPVLGAILVQVAYKFIKAHIYINDIIDIKLAITLLILTVITYLIQKTKLSKYGLTYIGLIAFNFIILVALGYINI